MSRNLFQYKLAPLDFIAFMLLKLKAFKSRRGRQGLHSARKAKHKDL